MSAVYRFEPVGLDAYAPTRNTPDAGELVRKVQPRGCPRNGTMGHCFVAVVGEPESRYALVLVNSLKRVKS